MALIRPSRAHFPRITARALVMTPLIYLAGSGLLTAQGELNVVSTPGDAWPGGARLMLIIIIVSRNLAITEYPRRPKV